MILIEMTQGNKDIYDMKLENTWRIMSSRRPTRGVDDNGKINKSISK